MLLSWITLTLLSAACLGVYEVAKKVSVRDNPVAPVLYLSAFVCASVWAPFVFWSALSNESVPLEMLRVRSLSTAEHFALFLKSLIVGVSWTLAYFAIKQIPISNSGPIRATSPFWTILFATLVFGERPSVVQWSGMALTLVAFYAFSLAGKLEGIHFHRDKWVGLMLVATLVAAISSLYDKYLLQDLRIGAATVQAWFSIYLLIVLLPMLVYWRFFDEPRIPFLWKPSIVLIAIALFAADFFYFTAISQPDALISVILTLRDSGVMLEFHYPIPRFCL